MSLQTQIYTVDDLWILSHQDKFQGNKLELIDGELKVHPVGREHGRVTLRLGSRMNVYVETHNLGEVTVEVGHYTSPKTALSPDVAFTSKARLPDDSVTGFVNQMPDLAVEVKSPSNTYEELHEKVVIYLKNGSHMVWVVYPKTQTIGVYTPPDNPESPQLKTLGVDDTLSGGDILPDFTLHVAEIFG